jgi:glycine/D-amino acid oxidase-like deaminating enzyme
MDDGPVWGAGDGGIVRPPLDKQHTHADLCVIGLGGSGLAAMAEAQRLGRTVVGIDGGQVAGGAAGRNGGFLLAGTPDFHHTAAVTLGHERAAAVYRLTLAELDRMEQALSGVVRRVGSVRIADSDDERVDCERMLAALRADGFAAEWYEGPEGDGVLLPADAAFDPLARCRMEADTVTAAGAHLYERTPAQQISGSQVTTPNGTIECDAVVVAVDGGLERLLPELEGRVRTARLQMLATESLDTEPTRFPRPVYARWGFDYWQQLPDGRIALGGCRDRFAEDEWSFAATPTEPVQACLDRLLRQRLGVPDRVAVTHRWAGCVGFTADHMPVCEEVRQDVIAIGGYCGTGNLLGALCGRAAARMAFGVPAAELAPLLSA